MHPSDLMNFPRCFIHTSNFEHLNTSPKQYVKILQLLGCFLANILNSFCEQSFIAP